MITPPAVSSTHAVLPPLFARWADSLLSEPVPRETTATCHDCVMACSREGAATVPAELRYLPSVKCCTYMPELPNFLVGGALADDDPAAAEGRRTVEARIARREAVTPLGLFATPRYRLAHDAAGPGGFGRTPSLLCPHYIDRDGGLCGVWRHRNSMCATWFCKTDRGDAGRAFWSDMLAALRAVERALRVWCVHELDVGDAALRELFPARGEVEARPAAAPSDGGGVDDAAYRARWGRWAGREHDFFRESARLVRGMAWSDVVRVGGPELGVRAHLVQRSFAAMMSRDVPPLLRHRVTRVEPLDGQRVRVHAAGAGEAVDMPAALAAALRHFDGRTPTDEAMLSIAMEARVGVQKWLVRQLVASGVLTPPDAEAPGPGTPGSVQGVAPSVG